MLPVSKEQNPFQTFKQGLPIEVAQNSVAIKRLSIEPSLTQRNTIVSPSMRNAALKSAGTSII
jgi:hypothetical protein